ncbi:hypothetical protein L596_029657 [Steinernema carpocapsae]|uniref:IGFBP N-terminal domain-containing protein n=1 Tax=Steinernema carpocapsae TaxID=34508 RepID=A0A4U5LVA4_STECR|nr:hypothetical protein L596_029657 [Steinernema carpocapsae]
MRGFKFLVLSFLIIAVGLSSQTVHAIGGCPPCPPPLCDPCPAGQQRIERPCTCGCQPCVEDDTYCN